MDGTDRTNVLPILFIVIISLVHSKSIISEKESVKLLIFAIELFSPLWDHQVTFLISFMDHYLTLTNFKQRRNSKHPFTRKI